MQNLAQNQRNSKRFVQNALNDLSLRTMRKLDISDHSARTVLAIEAAIGHSEPGEVVQRSRLAIAQGLRLNGDRESQKAGVSKLLGKLRAHQRKCGRVLIDIFPGTPDQAPGFCDHLGPLVEEADRRKREDPRWREDKAGKWAATDSAIDWIIENLPKAEPDTPTPEPSHLSLSEYVARSIEELKRAANQRVETIESRYSDTREAGHFLRELTREFARMSDSLTKTAPARLGADVEKGNTLESQKEELPFSGDRLPVIQREGANLGDSREGGGGIHLGDTLGSKSFDCNTDFSACENSGADKANNEATAEEAFFEPVTEAAKALDVFESVGASGPLEVLFLDDSKPEKEKAVRVLRPTPDETRESVGAWLEEAEAEGQSLVFRMTGVPREGQPGRARALIQIDDCDRPTLERLRPVSFLQVKTSRGSWQSWLALPELEGETETDTYARVCGIRDRLFKTLEKGAGNGGSYGSLRFPGSKNFKPNRRQSGGEAPFVEVVYCLMGRYVTVAELERCGLLLQPEPEKPVTGRQARPGGLPVTHLPIWIPNYQIELSKKGGDRSEADASFVTNCLRAGHSVSDTEKLLREVSEKAAGRRDEYVKATVRNVAAYLKVR